MAAPSSSTHITYPQLELADNDNDKGKGKKDSSSQDMEKRLWLGNLDPKLTEFQLLKLVQKFGTIEHFDFLFHRSGPNVGLPRGYAFVEFTERESAEKCMKAMNEKRILDRHLAIRWAKEAVKEYPDEQTKLKAKLPALAVSEATSSVLSKEKAINAIEAKLRAMEQEKDQLTINVCQSKSSGNSYKKHGEVNNYNTYKQQHAQAQTQTQGQLHRYNNYKQNSDRNRKPYSRR